METLSGNIERFFTALETPEYAYLFLEPILIWGVGFGLISFIFASLVREPKTQSFGLIVLIVSCMMVGPYCNKRKVAEKRIVPVYQVDQPSRASTFTAQTSERRKMQWLYYLTAILATATILLGIGKSKLGGVLMAATIVFGVITLQNEAWNGVVSANDAIPSTAIGATFNNGGCPVLASATINGQQATIFGAVVGPPPPAVVVEASGGGRGGDHSTAPSDAIVLEIEGVRVIVPAGFDADHLGQVITVIRALT